jgi:hypothetical protein
VRSSETGRRDRRRAAYAGIAGLALVVAVGVGIAKASDDEGSDSSVDPVAAPPSGPVDVEALSQGAPPELPLWYEGSLHVGDRTYDLRRPLRIEAAGSTSVIETLTKAESQLQLLTTSGLTTLPTAGRAVSWALSAPGDLVVWVDRLSGTRRELVAWDVNAGEVLARRRVDVEVICCDATGELFVSGIDAAGNVFGVTDDGFVWNPASGAHTRLAKVSYVDQVIASGPVLQSGEFSTGFPGEAMRWRDGALEQIGPLSYALAPVTPDGRLAAYASDRYGVSQAKGDPTAVAVETVGVGKPELFEFSRDFLLRPIGWEPDGAVLVAVSSVTGSGPADAWIVRCQVEAHQCEIALDLRGHGFWSGPE